MQERKISFQIIEGSFRFAVGRQDGRLSDIWKIWVGGDASFYMTCSVLQKGMKLSIHQDIALWGFTSQDYKRYSEGGFNIGPNRIHERFPISFQETNKVRTVASVHFPTKWLLNKTLPWPGPKRGVLYMQPVPIGYAICVSLQVGLTDKFPLNFNGLSKGVKVLGIMRCGESKRTLLLTQHVYAFPEREIEESLFPKFKGLSREALLTKELPPNGTEVGAVIVAERSEEEPIKLLEIHGGRIENNEDNSV